MATTASAYEFVPFPNGDWEAAAPPALRPAVVFIREHVESVHFEKKHIGVKIDALGHDYLASPVAFEHNYESDLKEAQAMAAECFDKFLRISKANRLLIEADCVPWAYSQTHALLLGEFSSVDKRCPLWEIKARVVDCCDGRQPPLKEEDFLHYALRRDWRAPIWLKLGTVEKTNEEDALVKWDDDGRMILRQPWLKKV